MEAIIKTLVIGMVCMSTAYGQHPGIPSFNWTDIGDPTKKGSVEFNQDNQSFTITGSGYNIWFERDEFYYGHVEITGDFIATANFSLLGEGVDPHRKTGWMLRTTLEEDAVHASAVTHGDGLTVLQWRPDKAASMRDPEDQIEAPKKKYTVMQLEREGNTIHMRAAIAGEALQYIGSHDFNELPETVNLGLFVCSHNAEILETARVWNVRIDKPVPDDYNPGESGWLQSRLETLNVFTGERKIIHTYESRFEAPNWMPDGNRLLFNQEGKLYTIGLDGTDPDELNTGFADRNNNDHGISFDGEKLAISHHREDLPGGGSTIYVVPIEGGEPQMVTERTPSYWHGWDPDNLHVVHVAQRDESHYDIYRSNIETGDETRLTNYKGAHVDGPEYTPDGRYIYYNASPTGTMQIWRMAADGSNKEQLTFDEFNNWFPHISPDGKWVAYLAYPPTIDPNSHPTYKRVTLKLMPLDGGPARTLAYLFGGQGTINVPSWSPDSKYISFVSYTR